jgi:hypothetical protein
MAMTHPVPTVAYRPKAEIKHSLAGAFAGVFFGSFFLLGGGVTLSSGVQIWGEELTLFHEGVRTEGTVMGRRISDDPENPEGILTVQFLASLPGSPSSALVQKDISVAAKHYEQLAPGQDVLLLHSRTNPGLFRLADETHHSGLPFFFLIGGFFTFLGGLFIIGSLWCFFELIQLACRGKSRPGWLENRWVETDGEGAKSFCVSYRFLTPSGDPQIGAEVSRRAFHELPPGSPVTVRTVPGRPEIYRLKL